MTRRLISSLTGAALLTAALGLLAGACAGDRGQSTSRRQRATMVAPPGAAQRPVDDTRERRLVPARWSLDVTVYYLRRIGGERYLAPERHAVPYVPSVDRMAAAAVSELLTASPRFLGTERPFSGGTRLLGLRLAAGTATVNLSRQALRASSADGYPLQTLVWTVTQLTPIKRVVVRVEGRSGGRVDGRPVRAFLGVGSGDQQLVRDRSMHLAPILLDEPGPRTTVTGSRVVAQGEARVASGAVGLRLRDGSGRVVSQGFATLAASPPAWGRFSGALVFTPPPRRRLWRLEAFETSPVDASVTYSVVVPVWVG